MAATEQEKTIDTVKETKVSPEDNETTEVNVLSVGLTDAVTKDQPNYRARSQLQLYGFVIFTTLSMFKSKLRG